MILNNNSTQQINTLVIQLQNRITNLNNEFNKKVSEINDEISDLDTLKKEIADLVKDQINVDSSMNKQITENKNNIAANSSSISELNTQIQTNRDNIATNTSDISALKTSVAGKADKNHTHTKSEITDFPTSLPANGGTADYSLRMKEWTIDLSAQSPSNFYPVLFVTVDAFAEVAVHSPSLIGTATYNQNRIHFDISTNGWADTPKTLNIREYACYENSEITIGCIGVGTQTGGWAIWLRGGMNYIMYTRNATPSLKTADYTHGTEIYTVGTNYYGGSNTNVQIYFTPQSTITEGAYSSRPITAPNIKANNKMRIPIGAPSQLEDGCIWIER